TSDVDNFLVKDDEGITEESEAKEVEYSNLEIVERFDIENIVYLNDEIFQDSEYDTDSKELQNTDDDDESMVGNKVGQGIFDFDSTDLAADLIREWGYDNEDNGLSRTDQCINNNSNTVDEEDASKNLSVENDSINLESLLIAL
ncbi:14979_t:CDS:1, partial [Racocetra persica]